MNSTDLFSFLGENAPEDDRDLEQDTLEPNVVQVSTKSAHKRKAESPTIDEDYHNVNIDNEPASGTKKQRMESTTSAPKRKVVSAEDGVDVPMQDADNESGPSAPKKTRMASPKPIVLDDFETEAKREVAASAGLTGSVDSGTRLELKHQVCSGCIRIRLISMM